MPKTLLLEALALSLTSVAPAQEDIFSNVALLQESAAPVLPAVGWKDLGSGGGFYGHAQIDLPAAGLVPSTVSYSISGKSGNRVDRAVISAFIASPRDLAAAKSKVQAAAAQWFQSAGRPVPPGLTAAIASGAAFQASAGGLSMRYAVERCTGNPIKQPDGSSYRCTTMELTIRAQ